MTDTLDALATAVSRARQTWAATSVTDLTASDLVLMNEQLAFAARLLDAARARVAGEVARRSRPEAGADGLAKKHGHRSPVAMISAVTGCSPADAARLVKVGEATAARATFSEEPAAPRHPYVADALAAGRIGAPAAAAIIEMLDRVGPRATREASERVEKSLVDSAPGLPTDRLHRLILQAEAHLDPGEVERREDEMRAERYLHLREDRYGRVELRALLDPEHAAPLKTAIDAIVTADLRAPHSPDTRNDAGSGVDISRAEVTDAAPRRSIPQLQADALTRLAEHALGCAHTNLPLDGATVIVRIDLDTLETGRGTATIDGLATPISAATARRMAAGGRVIPCVLGGDSDILDWGRARRLFTPAQRLALVERDGGCAKCGAPPSHTKAHHIRWWARDSGPTDLANGVLLCESCHHHIHDHGWDIRIDGTGPAAHVWFIPPSSIDPARTPRLGGRARFHYAA